MDVPNKDRARTTIDIWKPPSFSRDSLIVEEGACFYAQQLYLFTFNTLHRRGAFLMMSEARVWYILPVSEGGG
jgi:hypothetical protein